MKKSIHTRDLRYVLRLLREDREAAGLTQVDSAKKLALTQSQVSKIERGEVRLDILQLRAVCLAHGVTLADFAQRLERLLTASK